MNLKTAAEVAGNMATSAAIVVGGVWAYFKFIRGRTFAYRAELDLSIELMESTDLSTLRIVVSLKNAGLSKIPLNEKMKAVRVFRMRNAPVDRATPAQWERILTFPLLEQHDWLEAQETITDELLCVVPNASPPDHPFVAYQVEALVGAQPRLITRKRTRWGSRKNIVLASSPQR